MPVYSSIERWFHSIYDSTPLSHASTIKWFWKPRDKSAARQVNIPPFLVIHKPVQDTDMNFTWLRSGLQPHALFDTLGIIDYSVMAVATLLEPHQDKFHRWIFLVLKKRKTFQNNTQILLDKSPMKRHLKTTLMKWTSIILLAALTK
jgi:hypothetical protein